MIGDKIRQARNAKNLSQRRLAVLIGVKHNSICDWEKGRHKPNTEQIKLLCEALGINPNWLYGEKESKMIRGLTANDFLLEDGNELPKEAKEEINNFIEFIKSKYKK